MPPRKKAGINNLIGKIISMESKYDDKKLTGKLVSADQDYLGVEVDGRVFYFSKFVMRCIVEEVPNVEGN